MKQSFPPIGEGASAKPLSADFAVMLVGVAARQAASPTAVLAHEDVPVPPKEGLLAPQHGAFNQAVADDLKRWKETSTGRPDE